MSILQAQEEQLEVDEALLTQEEIADINDADNEDDASIKDNKMGHNHDDNEDSMAEHKQVVLVRTSLASNVEAGATKVSPASMAGFRVGYRFRLGSESSGYEERIITGFGSLLFEAPLEQSHGVGTELLMMALSPSERAALKKVEREAAKREARQSIKEAKAKVSEDKSSLAQELDIAVADLEDKSQQLPEPVTQLSVAPSRSTPSTERLEACRVEKSQLLAEVASIRLQLAQMKEGERGMKASSSVPVSLMFSALYERLVQIEPTQSAQLDLKTTTTPRAAELSFDQASPSIAVMPSVVSSPSSPPPITPLSSPPLTMRTPTSSAVSSTASSSWRRATRVVRSANRFQQLRKHTYEGLVIQKDVVIPPRSSSAAPHKSSTFRATTPLKRRSRQRLTTNIGKSPPTPSTPLSPSSPSSPSQYSSTSTSKRRDAMWISSPLREQQSPTSPRTPGSARAVVWVYSGGSAIALEPVSSSPGKHALSHAAMTMASLHNKLRNAGEEIHASMASRMRMKKQLKSHPAWVDHLAHVLAQPWCRVLSQSLGPALTAVAIAEAFLDDSNPPLGMTMSSHKLLSTGTFNGHQGLAAKCWALSWVMDACEVFCAHAIRTSPAAVAAAAEAAEASSSSLREMVAWKRRSMNRKHTTENEDDSSAAPLGVPMLGRLALRALLLPGFPAFVLSMVNDTWNTLHAGLSTCGSALLRRLPAGPLLYWLWAHVPPESGLRLRPLLLRTRLMARWLAWAMPVLRWSWHYMCNAVHRTKTQRRQAHERAAIAAAVYYVHLHR